MKYFLICLGFLFINHSINAQDANILNYDPDALERALEFPFKKIEIEIVQYYGSGATRVKAKGKSAFKIYEYANPKQCLVINKTKEGVMDTTTFIYDKCGGLLIKKGHEHYSEYNNRYKNCVLMSKKANETDIFTGGFSHQLNLIRYEYNKNGQVSKEVTYDYEDSTLAKFSYEYSYVGKVKEALKEYYFDEDGKKLFNRMSKYFYTNNLLDSMVHYNAENTPIDKIEYSYYPNGKVKSIKNGPDFFEYFYINEVLEMIKDQVGGKEYNLKLIE